MDIPTQIVHSGSNGEYIRALRNDDMSTNYAKRDIWMKIHQDFVEIGIPYGYRYGYIIIVTSKCTKFVLS